MAAVAPFTVRAEPLTEQAFAPFGQVIAAGDMAMELRGDEVFHLNVLHYERRPLRCDHLNRHHRATHALVALGGWGLLRGGARATVALGFGTTIVVGAVLIVFAALLPWLGDGPVRIGPLAVTLRIQRRIHGRARRRRRARR